MPDHRRATGFTALLLALAASSNATAQTATIRQYQFAPRTDGAAYEVVLKHVPRPSPAAHEVLSGSTRPRSTVATTSRCATGNPAAPAI